MTKFLLAAVTVAALSATAAAPAAAADISPRMHTKAVPMASMYNWSGVYLGANGGYGTSRQCWDIVVFTGAAVGPLSEGCHNADGATFGGQLGYRWQSNAWVYGLEAQGNWADFEGSNGSGQIFARNESEIRAFGLFTGQLGYAWNNMLLYVKGGAAVTNSRYRGYTLAGAEFDNAEKTRWGGVVGVGLEYGFTQNWSFGIEYNHMFFGDRDVTLVSNGLLAPAGASIRTDRISQDVDLITARLNYKFGGGRF